MSYYALKAIKEANYQITFNQLHRRLVYLLDDEGYDQTPQLEGKTENKKKQIFS